MNQALIHIFVTGVLCLLCSCAPRQEAIDRYYYMEMSPNERAYTDSMNEMTPDQQSLTEIYREEVASFFHIPASPAISEGMLLVEITAFYHETAKQFYGFRDLTPPKHLEELHLQVADTMTYIGDFCVECASVLEQNASEQPTQEEIIAVLTPIIEKLVNLDESSLELFGKELGI